VEDYFEDPLDLRLNPLEEGEVDVEHSTQEGSQYPSQDQCTNQG